MTLREVLKKIGDGDVLLPSEEIFLVSQSNTFWTKHPDVTVRFPRLKKVLAWVAGFQYYDYNLIKSELQEIKKIGRKRRLTFNKMRGFFKTFLGKLTADSPNMGVMPNTTEEADVEAAVGGDKVVDGLSYKIGFKSILNKLKAWLILDSVCYLRVFWNKDDFGVVEYKEETDEATGEKSVSEIREPGDVGMEAVSPLSCRPDPLFSDPAKWRWFEYGEEADAEALEEEYNLKPGTLTENESESNQLDPSFDFSIGADNDFNVATADRNEDVSGRVVVRKEVWTKDFYWFTAGNTLLEYGEHDFGRIPFFRTEDLLIPIESHDKGITYNSSVMRDIIPIQREYNRQKSIISLAIERASKLKVLVPSGSLMSKRVLDDDAGVFIDFNPKAGGEPHQMRLDPMPGDIHSYAASLESEFMNVAGLHESSFGRLPERASHASGALVNLLLEQDDIVLNPMLESLNEMLSKAWTLALKIVQDKYSIARIIKYIGEDNEYAAVKFKGSDLRGNTDVKVTSQMGLPRSRALKAEYVMRMKTAQLIVDPKMALEMLEVPDVDKMFKDVLVHEKKAKRENQAIIDDPKIDPESTKLWVYQYEDHQGHIKIHIRERVSSRYDKLTPNQKQALDNHIAAHMQVMQAQAQAQAQAQLDQQMKAAQAQAQARAQAQGKPTAQETGAPETPAGEQVEGLEEGGV